MCAGDIFGCLALFVNIVPVFVCHSKPQVGRQEQFKLKLSTLSVQQI